jgi:hypothetical protein
LALSRTPTPPKAGESVEWHHHDEYSVVRPDSPEMMVAYQKDAVTQMLSDSGLSVDSIHMGSWNTAEDYLSYQDIITVHK